MRLVHSCFASAQDQNSQPEEYSVIITLCKTQHFLTSLQVRMLFLLLFSWVIGPTVSGKLNQNKLFPEYGINFRYIGEIKNGLDRVSVVTSVPLPHFKDIQISPLKFHNCSMDLDLNSAISKEHRHLQIAVSEWCAKATPYMQHLRKKEKYFIDQLYGLL